jgi:hypothetical protein
VRFAGRNIEGRLKKIDERMENRERENMGTLKYEQFD